MRGPTKTRLASVTTSLKYIQNNREQIALIVIKVFIKIILCYQCTPDVED